MIRVGLLASVQAMPPPTSATPPPEPPEAESKEEAAEQVGSKPRWERKARESGAEDVGVQMQEPDAVNYDIKTLTPKPILSTTPDIKLTKGSFAHFKQQA